MSWVEVVQDIRLVLVGVLLAVTIALPGIGALVGGSQAYRWLAGGTAAAAVFLMGNYIQLDSSDPAMVVLATKIQITALMAWAPLGAMLVENARPGTTPRWLIRSVAVAALLPWAGELVATNEVYQRPNAHGEVVLAAMSGPLFPVLALFALGTGIHLVRGFVLAEQRLTVTQRRGAVVIVALLAAALLHDALVFTGKLRSLVALDLVVGLSALMMVGLLRETVVEQRHKLARAVDEATADLQFAREELTEAVDNLQTLIDAHPGMILLYRDSTIVAINGAGREWLALPKMGGDQPVSSLLTPIEDSGPRLGEREVTSVASHPYEERFARADGTPLWGEVVELELLYAGLPTTLAIVRDVTERRRLDRQLVAADRLASLGTLAAGVAHEINNPLTYVITNLELARVRVRNDDVREMLDDASEGAFRVSKIVAGLGAFSRRTAPREVVAVRIDEVVATAVKLVKHELRHRAELTVDLPDELPLVFADEAELVQLMLNLLINAAHAIDEAPDRGQHRVHIRASDAGGRVQIAVEDSGVGLDETTRDHLFEPFYTTKPVGKGTGLGLSICHGIVDALGGELELANRPGGGAIAQVMLPATSDAVTDPGPAPKSVRTPRADSEGLEVLLVDDDELVGRSMERMLAQHQVTFVDSGEECLERCEQRSWDLILCDVMMPGLSGLEVLEALRRDHPALAARFVLITGGLFGAEDEQALTAANVPVLYKPLDAKRLRETMATMVDP